MEFLIKQFIMISQRIRQLVAKLSNSKDSHDDEDLGEFKDPKQVILSIISVIVAIGFVSVVYTLIDGSDVEINGMGEFNRQKGVKFGVTQARDANPENRQISLEQRVENKMPLDVCFELHQKVKNNNKLNSIEFSTYKDCLKTGKIDGVNERQRKIFEALANPELHFTDKEREIMQRVAEGLGSELDDLISDGLLSDDPFTREVAKKLASGELSEEDAKILEDYLKGNIPKEIADAILNGSEEEKRLAREAYKKHQAGEDISKELQDLKKMQEARKIAQGDIEQIKSSLNDQLQANEQILRDVEEELAQVESDISRLKNIAEVIGQKKDRGEKLTAEEEAILEEYENLLAKKEDLAQKKKVISARIKGIEQKLVALLNENINPEDMEGLINFVSKGVNNDQVEEVMQALEEEVKANEATLKTINNEVASVEKEIDAIKTIAEEVLGKKKRGGTLTPEEEKIIEEYERLTTKRDELLERKKQVVSRIQDLQSKLIALANGQYDQESLDRMISFLKKNGKGNFARIKDVSNAKKVSPSEFRLIKKLALLRKGTGFESSLYPNTLNSEGGAKEAPLMTQVTDPASLITYAPDLRVPCVSMNYIGVSKENMKGQRFMCQISDNILHPETFEIIVPKGSIAVGETDSFDSNTKMLKVKMKSIRAGKKVLPFAFRVISPSGMEGIRGDVKTTKGIMITAAFLMDFFSGVVQFFTNQAQIQLAQQGAGGLSLTNAISGGAYQGVSSGLNRTSETLAQELQGASEVYFTPSGHKLFLIPEI